MDHQYEALPPGFRFHPTDEELITFYLLKKVLDSNFTTRAIAEVDLNKSEPWHLPGKAKMGEKEWYFFSLRDRKYPTGLRTNRATESGYWKATGKDREIFSSRSCSLVGMKKTLVFYRGRAPKGEKTGWVMHEYRLEGNLAYHHLSRNSKGEWVISRVFQKTGVGSSSSSVCGGATKKQPPIPEVSSPSSVSLPPLLEPSSASNDRESCSYDGGSIATLKEHVPCFSMTGLSGFNSLIEPSPLPAPSYVNNPLVHDPTSWSSSTFATYCSRIGLGGSPFPSLRSLHENLQLPFFLSNAAPPPVQGGTDQMCAYGNAGQWPQPENQKVGATELDCMWSY